MRWGKIQTRIRFFGRLLTSDPECWLMTGEMQCRIQAAEKRFLQRVSGIALHKRVRSSEFRSLIRPNPYFCEMSKVMYKGHMIGIFQEKHTRLIIQGKPTSARP